MYVSVIVRLQSSDPATQPLFKKKLNKHEPHVIVCVCVFLISRTTISELFCCLILANIRF